MDSVVDNAVCVFPLHPDAIKTQPSSVINNAAFALLVTAIEQLFSI
jgi:hypothetical protein